MEIAAFRCTLAELHWTCRLQDLLVSESPDLLLALLVHPLLGHPEGETALRIALSVECPRDIAVDAWRRCIAQEPAAAHSTLSGLSAGKRRGGDVLADLLASLANCMESGAGELAHSVACAAAGPDG